MRTLSLVTSCTKKKRVEPLRQLTARTLPKGSANALSREWTKRLHGSRPVALAKDLYQGRAFSEVRKLSEVADAPLYIISAGLGLLRADEQIPSYSLTVSNGSSDTIQDRCVEGTLSPGKWWEALTQRYGRQNPLTELITGSTGKLWLIALSSNYFDLIASDLDQLSDARLEHIRIVGLPIGRRAHRVIEACSVDVDDRLNGPDSPLRGTQMDFAQRAARFVYDAAIKSNSNGDISAHRRTIARKLSGWRPPRRYDRQSMCDEVIMARIQRLWDEVDGHSSKLLRMLRDEEQIACEQARFLRLFRRIQKEIVS